jgi:hypothetical protein
VKWSARRRAFLVGFQYWILPIFPIGFCVINISPWFLLVLIPLAIICAKKFKKVKCLKCGLPVSRGIMEPMMLCQYCGTSVDYTGENEK